MGDCSPCSLLQLAIDHIQSTSDHIWQLQGRIKLLKCQVWPDVQPFKPAEPQKQIKPRTTKTIQHHAADRQTAILACTQLAHTSLH